MAPTLSQIAEVGKRAVYCSSGYYYSGGRCVRYSGWYWWGRWVFAGLIVVFFILVLAGFARKNARRRRGIGQQPLYGTGFLAGPAPPYTPYQGGGPPPPQYNQQQPVYPENTGNKFNTNDGYYANYNNNQQPAQGSSPYGNQQEGIQLQQPAQTYQRSTVEDYAPPEGPPPRK
ncbi:chitin synthesis regulation, resistance to congo red-domain-containing protein [Apodospora peruviana]|uniref:Chitin synthesis regulation, resistance to congo red-domain-containing protein n=1 Tax=Apodospora peruviana TaxID=516989 RepID=A0AAE0IQ77_9PEZI|nr:chitin synthesis regulation, resistance to congo red-domain-containing protein [Apodospora peruviana]